ncbi:MAG: hypothetical protein ACYDC0_16760 [Acidimicrobiales bacterium]
MLITRGLLPLWRKERWVYFDSKSRWDRAERDEPAVNGVGIPVQLLPRKLKDGGHYRLILPSMEYRDETKAIVTDALTRIAHMGDTLVVFDEAAYLFGERKPSLGLSGFGQDFFQRAGGNGITVIAATQAARNVPTSMYDQAALAFIGNIKDTVQRKRFREMEAGNAQIENAIDALERYQFVLLMQHPDTMVITRYEGGTR